MKPVIQFLLRLLKALIVGLGAILFLSACYYAVKGVLPFGIFSDVIHMIGFVLAMGYYFAPPKWRKKDKNDASQTDRGR
ncbi:hypothetical protein [Rhodanobacter denitrificans]|uniref:hypothetical protein n=1 Tax=Rhodanobacter denitrificans TaxID=666685 RepID=UPI0012FDA3EB|nr:hypothetical protein [Rhodanobacter denitrificans]UJJ58786.1 hypothetical protein LRK55_01235 [Rhodanobacter denitrificans]UJM87681.1 hypothetical protein LRJ86_05055 [Rhodanobacter denitrificans]